MRYSTVVVLVLVAAAGCFAGYCYALFDWIQDIRGGVYQHERFEGFCETSALVGYHAYGLHFLRTRKA